jgi:hypothetical protein
MIQFLEGILDFFLQILHALRLVNANMHHVFERAFDGFRRVNQFIAQIPVGCDKHTDHDRSPLLKRQRSGNPEELIRTPATILKNKAEG